MTEHPHHAATAAPIRILIADDHEVVRIGLAALLDGQPGFSVVAQAGSGDEAVRQARRVRPDVVVMDIRMPNGSGVDACRVITRELPDTPVVMLTSHAAASRVHKSRDCGASFVVTKPLTPTVLLQRIVWLSADEREFIEAPGYVGPDRRVRNMGPPLNVAGRRSGDLSTHVGAAVEANMDQSDIDNMFKPRRVAL